MKVAIENMGAGDVRVIIDDDPAHDMVLEAGASDIFESEGDIELRELEEDDEEDEDSSTDSEPSSS